MNASVDTTVVTLSESKRVDVSESIDKVRNTTSIDPGVYPAAVRSQMLVGVSGIIGQCERDITLKCISYRKACLRLNQL